MSRRTLVGTLTSSLLVGLFAGLIARVAMRGVAAASGATSEFDVGATVGIVFLFVLAAVGSGVAGLLRGRRAWRLLLAAASSALLLYAGVLIGAEEVRSALEHDIGTGSMVIVVLLTLAIVLSALTAPLLSWGLGTRNRDLFDRRTRTDIPLAQP